MSMSTGTQKKDNFFINQSNMTKLYSSLTGQKKLSDQQKQVVLKTIINEMRGVYDTLDQKKLSSLKPNQIPNLNQKLLGMVESKVKESGVINSTNSISDQNRLHQPMPMRPQASSMGPKRDRNTTEQFGQLYPGSSNNFDRMQQARNQMNETSFDRSGGNSHGQGQTDNKTFDDYQAERNTLLRRNEQRPSTPDFLKPIDVNGKKVKEESRRDYPPSQAQINHQQPRQQRLTQEIPGMPSMGITNEHGGNGELGLDGRPSKDPNKPIFYNSNILETYNNERDPLSNMAYNATDDTVNDLNNFTTGIDPKSYENFKEKDLDQALAQMEQMRSSTNTKQDAERQQYAQQTQQNNQQQTHQYNQQQTQQYNQQQYNQQQYNQHREDVARQQLIAQQQRQSQNSALALPDANMQTQLLPNANMMRAQQSSNTPQPMNPQMTVPAEANRLAMEEEKNIMMQRQMEAMNAKLVELQERMTNPIPTANPNSDLISQVNNLNAELHTTKAINSKLSSELDLYKNGTKNGNDDSSQRLELINQKKREIKTEMETLMEKHRVMEEDMNRNKQRLDQINIKKAELMDIIKTYDFKIFGGEYDLVVHYSDLKQIDDEKPIYRYELPYQMENVVQLMLKDHNFGKLDYNVTPYNNHLVIKKTGDYNDESDKLEDIHYLVCGIKDQENCHKISITIEPGKYDHDTLTKRVNTVLTKFNLEMGYDPIKYIFQIKSTEEFSLIQHNNSVYDLLGLQVDDECEPTKYFKGKKMADLSTKSLMDIYVLNVTNDKPLGKVNIKKGDIMNNILIPKPHIEKLEYLDIILMDEYGKPSWQEYTDFNFIVTLKGNIIDQDKYIKNFETINDVRTE